MREQFITKRFNAEHTSIIALANQIASDYRAQGYDLTLRQLYYQFVSRALIANKDTEYKRLGSIINDARLAGEMDWSFIQDRGRNVKGGFSGYRDPGHYLEDIASGYFENIWHGQDWRPEVWVEKEALIDVIGQACGPTRTPHFACKGYVSQSEMYAAAKRIEKRRRQGHRTLVIHLGDHDPSGIDMTRDIQDRLSLMSNGWVEVRRIALNMDQVEQYDPPPNPAKLTDSRGSTYVEEYGDESWELDALDPATLTALIQDALGDLIDSDEMDARIANEQAGEARIEEIASRWEDIEANWSEILEMLP